MEAREIFITPVAEEDIREIFIGKYRVAYYIVSNEQIDILRIHRAGGAG